MAIHVMDRTAKGVKRADSSTKVRPFRTFSSNKYISYSVLIPCKNQTVWYYNVWSLRSNASVITILYSTLRHHLEINKMGKPLFGTICYWGSKILKKRRLKTTTWRSPSPGTRQVISNASCSIKQFSNSATELSASELPSYAWPSWHDDLISLTAFPVRSILLASLEQRCKRLEVGEYNDKECLLDKDRGGSARLRTLHDLGTTTLKYIFFQEIYHVGNSSPEAGSSNELACLTRAGIEWENEHEKFISGLDCTKTKIYKNIWVDLDEKGNEAPQDKFHIC